MPRPPRIHVPFGFYHVTLRGNHQRAVFFHDGDQRLLNVIVARALATHSARLHAYCWMSNHLHFLIQVGADPLAGVMRAIASEFAREMQKKLDTTGHFFERRYHAKLVDVDAYFLELVRYIHLNPVRAKMVARPESHAWSSHHAYVGARDEAFVTTEFALSMFGMDPVSAIRAYLEFLGAREAQEWEPAMMSADPALVAPLKDEFAPRSDYRPKDAATLDDLIDEACRRFEVTRERLESPVRDRYVTQVRAWIAHQAVSRYICGLAAVGRALNRDESTLREAMRIHAREVT